ncbi:MAG: MBL fold metallo-hydrolase [Proteobacteria bacterium]|nr:MBL fold metallo-hydrolase [Pseudomonadota bacterium]
MKIIPLGAVENVTGSCFLIETEEKTFLIDCGLFQGEDTNNNQNKFPFNSKEVDFLILTHAHLDHSGRIPYLVKMGFKGKIFCTKATFELTKIMLLDSAKVMYEDYLSAKRKALRRGEEVREPLYYEEDVIDTYDSFFILDYDQEARISPNIVFKLRDAGHIIGSSYVELTVREKGESKRIIFSGDLGNRNKPIVRDPACPSKDINYLFIESTYGDREHKNFQSSYNEFKSAILETFQRGGNVIIPSFALERTQELLYLFREMYEKRELPPCRVFLDSPLAIKATNLFAQYYDYFDEETKRIYESGKNPFYFPYLILTSSVEDSKNINNIKERAIIIAGSGMCNGGRILHHLKHNLWSEKNSIIFTGFQAKGTLGRKIVDGEKYVYIYGEHIQVRAKIYTINGFSSHADKNILLNFISHLTNLKKIFLIHGEREVMLQFKKFIENSKTVDVSIPKKTEDIIL